MKTVYALEVSIDNVHWIRIAVNGAEGIITTGPKKEDFEYSRITKLEVSEDTKLQDLIHN